MSQNNSNEKLESMELIKKINEVPGFNPELFAVEYNDLESGETSKRLPVIVQMAWCRMKYPESKFAVSVVPAKDCFVATARVYASYKDPLDCYLSEATASRSYQADKPTVSPREWAQTAALGIALRNAGFGLQFTMAGAEFENLVADELGVRDGLSGDGTPVNASADNDTNFNAGQNTVPESNTVIEEPQKELTPEEKYEAALKVPCTISKFKGRTMGEVLMLDPSAIKWIAEKYTGSEELKAAANIILEHSVQSAPSAE